MIAKYCLGIAFLIVAVIQDIKEYKIKNVSVLIFLIAGLTLSSIQGHAEGLLYSLIGIVVPLVLLPLFALRMLGAGDIKAFCALGAIFGTVEIIKIMAISFIAGGVIAIGFMIFRKNGLRRFTNLLEYLKFSVMIKKPAEYNGTVEKDAVFRFAYAILAGYIIYVILSFVGKI